MLWAIFASALFSSNSWKPEQGRCDPFLYAEGASEPARILVQIPLMEFQNLHPGVCISHQTGPSTIVLAAAVTASYEVS
jgi:hypothetical protein